jgi:hypothetical protein
MSENAHESHQYSPPFTDVLISLLGALVIGGVVWAGGFGTVAAINYAGEVFQIYPPANDLINTGIQIGFVAVPILAGLTAAWLAYRFLLKLD